jgi:hypothetical protein
VNASVEILQIEKLIKSTNYGITKRGGSFFELFDAERLQRPEAPGTLHER